LTILTISKWINSSGIHSGSKKLKGIVQPKMKILSAFTHPQVVPNLLNTKEDILKNVVNQTGPGPH